MDRRQITAGLKTLIEDDREIRIESEDERLDIDSYTMMLAITYIKEEFGVELDMDQLDFDAFTSLNTLADLVLAKAAEAAPAS